MIDYFEKIFVNIPEKSKKDFWKLFASKTYKVGDYFIKKNDRITKIAFIKKGVTRTFLLNNADREVTLSFAIENDFIAGGFINNNLSNYYIEIIELSEMLVADYAKVVAFFDEHTDFKRNALKLADFYIKKKQDRILKSSFMTALERYKCFLKDYPGLINRIPHYIIANYLNITPTQLSRLRKEYVKK